MSRLRFAQVTAVSDTTATVTLDGASVDVALPAWYSPPVGEVAWLGQDGRRLTLLGYRVAP